MALKCYSGGYENHPGNPGPEEPELRNCKRHEDLCLWSYNSFDITIRGRRVVPAGSWAKSCEGRSSRLLEEFNGDFSARCIETTLDLTVCNIDVLNHY